MTNDEKTELTLRYIERFGAETLPPLAQMPASEQTEDCMLALLERALREDRPATDFIDIDNDPDVIY